MRHRIAMSLVLVMLAALALVACSKPVSSTPQSASVGITVTDTQISASRTSFSPGVLYHFSVASQGTHAHELSIEQTAMEQMPMGGMNWMATTGNVMPGQMATFDYTFTTAMTQQDLEFGCFYQGHQDLRLRIQVG